MEHSKILEMVAEDMKADAKHFDGQAFNGRNVATYFGKQGAAIAALADIVKSLVNKEEKLQCPINHSLLIDPLNCPVCGDRRLNKEDTE